MKREKPKEKSRASMIIDGEIEPETPKEKALLNLRNRKSFNEYSKEELTEISRKGAKAIQELHGEKKTARESLEKILTLKITDDIISKADVPPEIAERLRRDNPNATIYDLIHIVAVGRAIDGSINAMTYIRDTHGDKPKESVEITGDITTEQDRALLQTIANRLQDGEHLEIVKDV